MTITITRTKKVSPCYKCDGKRTVNCHSTCLDYIEWDAENKKEKKARSNSQSDGLSPAMESFRRKNIKRNWKY